MISRVAGGFAILLWAVTPLWAGPVITAGTHYLLPGTQTQISINASGGDVVTGVDLYLQVADGGTPNNGTATKPIVTALDIVNDPRTIFYVNNTGASTFNEGGLIWGATTTTDESNPNTVYATGTLALVTVDTAGTAGGQTYPWKVKDVYAFAYPPTGLKSEFYYGLTTTANDGQIIISAGAMQTPGASELQTILSQLDATGALSKSGPGTVVLTGGINHTAALSVNGGTLRYNFSGGKPVTIGTSATMTIASGATVELAGTQTGTSDGTRHVSIINNSTSGGLSVFGTQAVGGLSGSGNTTVQPGGNLTVNYVRQNSLWIKGTTPADAGKVTVRYSGSDNAGDTLWDTPLGTGSTSKLSSLVIDGTTDAWLGTLDLKNNDLVLQSTLENKAADVARITNQIKQGCNNYYWNGRGITSSVAADDSAHVQGVGVADNALWRYENKVGGTGGWSGQTVDANSILVKHTFYGDANLDGLVNGTDVSQLLTGLGGGGSGWTYGDFNYDGVINGTDVSLLLTSLGAMLPQVGGGTSTAYGTLNQVPEPGTPALLLTLGALCLAGYRWRARHRATRAL